MACVFNSPVHILALMECGVIHHDHRVRRNFWEQILGESRIKDIRVYIALKNTNG